MTEPTSATPRSNYFYAALAAAFGVYFFTLGAGLLPIPGGPSNLHGPQWLLLCVGLAFFLAGVAIVIQTLGHANAATGNLPADAPRWMGVVQYLIGLTIFVCFGVIASWIAFGPGERHFSGTFVFGNAAGSGNTFTSIVCGCCEITSGKRTLIWAFWLKTEPIGLTTINS